MEQCRLCPTKSQRHSFRGQNNNKNYLKTIFSFLFSNFFCKSILFQRSIQLLGPLFKEKIFCVTVPLTWLPPLVSEYIYNKIPIVCHKKPGGDLLLSNILISERWTLPTISHHSVCIIFGPCSNGW